MPPKKFYIPKKKIKHYLLSSKHQQGKDKAFFFKYIGLDSFVKLNKVIILIAKTNKPDKILHTSYGNIVVTNGTYSNEKGKKYKIRTVWIEKQKRFDLVSAHPKKL